MRVLLDTHALLWWFAGNQRLSETARRVVDSGENEILVSAASSWEAATKHRLGKLPEAALFVTDPLRMILGEGFVPLDVSIEHAMKGGRLPGPHRDPFDRLLIAQAEVEGCSMVTKDKVFLDYSIHVLW